MNPARLRAAKLTRRHFFEEAGLGVGKIALAALLGDAFAPGVFAAAAGASTESINTLAPRPPHFAPKAKRVIHLFMAGAPSQLDLFDRKPELTRLEGKPLAPFRDRRATVRLHPPGRGRARPPLPVRQARGHAAPSSR